MHALIVMKSKRMVTSYKTVIFVFMFLVICVFIQQKLTVHFGILKYEGVNIMLSPLVDMIQPGDRIPEDYWKNMKNGTRAVNEVSRTFHSVKRMFLWLAKILKANRQFSLASQFHVYLSCLNTLLTQCPNTQILTCECASWLSTRRRTQQGPSPGSEQLRGGSLTALTGKSTECGGHFAASCAECPQGLVPQID